MENGVVVDLKGVEKAFGEEKVLRGLDLQVRAGETLVIIGKSGSGKSVTIRHIVGIEEPDSGKVLVFGEDLATLGKRERNRIRLRMGYLFQSGALLNWMTVAENVALPLLEHRRELRAEERKKLVLDKLRLVEMENAANKYPADISGGMKKRAALARAVILDPEIILYDEPTSGLDPVIASTIGELIIRTAKTLGSTQIVVTHDMESANKIADRIAMLYQGKIVAVGTPAEIKKSKDPIVHQFITGAIQGPLSGENHA